MTKLTRESLLARAFSDTKNYPYGFSRSGDFSISESKALSQYGCLIAALADAKIGPENAEDEGYLAAIHGQKAPETAAEKAWVKYQKRTSLSDDEDTVVEDSDLEIEMDD